MRDRRNTAISEFHQDLRLFIRALLQESGEHYARKDRPESRVDAQYGQVRGSYQQCDPGGEGVSSLSDGEPE